MAGERWPFSFDLDDVEVKSVFKDPVDGKVKMVDGKRLPGVYVKHEPTGDGVVMMMQATRDENLALAFQRLDQLLRRRQRRG